jgi:hypothetical protein
MQLLHNLALVAALCCMGSGAASELRGAVRAEVGSNQCTCNLEWGGLVWPTSECECKHACKETCCYFSQPGQFDQLMSGCQCKGQTHNIFDTATITTGCSVGCSATGICWPYPSSTGNSYYDVDNAGANCEQGQGWTNKKQKISTCPWKQAVPASWSPAAAP